MSSESIHADTAALVDAIVTHALQPNDHELLRHLAVVLGLNNESRVLLIADRADESVRILQELGCEVEHYGGNPQHLPFETASFNSAIVALPIPSRLHEIARELHRVLKPNGTLGMVTFSVYRDQMPDDQALSSKQNPLLTTGRPAAAAYRAVLAECGFTAFVSEDRRRDVRLVALNSYRKLLLQKSDTSVAEPRDPAAQALELMALGGVGITLITAEKGL